MKTLRDPEARKISLVIKEPLIEQLLDLPAPHYSNKAKRNKVESQVVRLRGWIVGYKEEEDGDYHVIFAPNDLYREGPDESNTIIIEFPAPICIRGAYLESRMLRALQQFDLIISRAPGRDLYELPSRIQVEVTGVPFFDKIHGQVGRAKNGIELHPVLSVRRLFDG